MSQEKNKLAIFDFSRTLANGAGEVYPGIVEEIKQLKANGWKLAVVSMSPDEEIAEDLGRVPAEPGKSLHGMFDIVVGSDTLKLINGGNADKTSRNVSNHVLAATGSSPSRAVVVGDAFTELLMAKNARMGYLHAGWDDPDKEGLRMVLGLGVPIDEVDVEMAQSIPQVAQINDRLEAELAPKKQVDDDLQPQR